MAMNFSVTMCVHAKCLQLYPTLCDPVDCSPSGSSVHGILQARIHEWVAISYFPTQGLNLCLLCLLLWQVGSLPLVTHGKPFRYNTKAKIRKEIIDKLDFIKNKCFISVKSNIKKM